MFATRLWQSGFPSDVHETSTDTLTLLLWTVKDLLRLLQSRTYAGRPMKQELAPALGAGSLTECTLAAWVSGLIT